MPVVKRPYVPDLAKQSALFKMNYARLLRLLPASETKKNYRIEGTNQRYLMALSCTETFTYTTTYTLEFRHEPSSKWLGEERFVIRLYHDVSMAEVVGFKPYMQYQGRYDYPNENMYQPDEKFQLNQHLGEWLSYCLNQGASSLHEFYNE